MGSSRRWQRKPRPGPPDPETDESDAVPGSGTEQGPDGAAASSGTGGRHLVLVVLPGASGSPRQGLLRNPGTREVSDLAVTNVRCSGETVSLELPFSCLLPGEACVLTLDHHASGEVYVAGKMHVEGGQPADFTLTATVPVPVPVQQDT